MQKLRINETMMWKKEEDNGTEKSDSGSGTSVPGT